MKQDHHNKIMLKRITVAYFDQLTNACACVSMVENDKKLLEINKNIIFPSWAQEAHVRLTEKYY